MPVSVEFRSRETGKVVPVSRVDDQIREYWGEPPSEDRFSPWYSALGMTAIAISYRGDKVDEDGLENYLAERDHTEADVETFYREFLLTRFEVSAYRAG